MIPQKDDKFFFFRVVMLILVLGIVVAGMGLAAILLIGMLKTTYYDASLIFENILLWVNE